jgi:hypothetical protein
MTGLIRKATLLATLGLVVATSAMAGRPVAANCSAPAFIKVVGTAGGTPDSRGTFTVLVQDIAPAPIANCLVQVDFTNCSDMRLCNTGAGVTCATSIVSALTNVSGIATFTIVGGGLHPGGIFPGPGAGCVSIYAGGDVLVGTATAVLYDPNGALPGAGNNGVNIGDLGGWLADLGGGVYRGRADFDQDGTITIGDLATWLQAAGAGTSSSGCTTTYCP